MENNTCVASVLILLFAMWSCISTQSIATRNTRCTGDTKDDKGEIDYLIKVVKQQSLQIQELSEKSLSQEALLTIISDDNERVAFTASKSSNLQNYHRQKIIYDKIITNVGGAYSNSTGIFTCSKSGVYVFTWSTMSKSGLYQCEACIFHNDIKLLHSYSVEGRNGTMEAASNTIVLSLIRGDQVWIETTNGWYYYGYPYTSFSGWKIN